MSRSMVVFMSMKSVNVTYKLEESIRMSISRRRNLVRLTLSQAQGSAHGNMDTVTWSRASR